VTDFDRRKALDAALAATSAASAELMKRFRPAGGEMHAWQKAPGAPVTDADLASDRAIAAALEAGGAPGEILSEEGRPGETHGPLTWLVDPLCGTSPYRYGLAHWGINLALRDVNSLEIAVLAVPTAGDVFLAVRGRGAARNGNRCTASAPHAPLSEAAVCVEIDNGSEWPIYAPGVTRWAPAIGAINMYGSIAYPASQLLQGRLAALVVFRVAPVHVAAGALLAEEVGLRVSDVRGEPIDWSQDGDLPSLVMGWPEHHAALIEAITRA
jgi:myo-inositol-1(or 4)-monophosphatase